MGNPSPDAASFTRTEFVDIPSLALDSGEILSSVRLAYETYGTLAPERDNAILICHALSGDAHAAGRSASPISAVDGIGADERGLSERRGTGWWDNLIGTRKAFDTDRYFVICSNIIGSCRGSTGPSSIDPATGQPYATTFPVITVGDMVRAQRALLDVLGIEKLLAVAGGSLGGMQALEWSVAYRDEVRACIMTAGTARLGAQGTALNAIAREAIMADPNWQHGRYYGSGRSPDAGIAVARMIGHVTYLSAHTLESRFGRRLQDRDEYSYTLTNADFAIESYLRHQGRTFASRFDANSYLYISRALTYFDLARSHGEGSLARAVSKTTTAYLLISFNSDWMYPPSDAQELESALRGEGKDVISRVIDTSYGHDSFLLDDVHQAPIIAGFLDRVHSKHED